MSATKSTSPKAEVTLETWKERAQQLSIQSRAFIEGKYVDSVAGKTYDCVSPRDGSVIATVAECDSEDVDRAVIAARRAFYSGIWSKMAPAKRKRIIGKFAQLILANRDELALLETLDMGKPIRWSTVLDIPGAANAMSWYAELLDKVYDEVAPLESKTIAMIRREPVGVVAAVVPWNFPCLIAVTKIAPALAAGNSVILKPAEQSPLTAIRLGSLAAEAGIPDGVFSVLPGFGHSVGKAIGLHLDIDCITFTGSTEVGRYFQCYAGDSNMKQVSLECGGKSPNIVFADAPDLEAAARAAALAIFFNQGEVCTAGARLLVEESIRKDFVARVVEIGKTMQPGDPLDPKSQVGAMVDTAHHANVMRFIESGKEQGAVLRLGGNACRQESGGVYIEPTIFDGVTTNMSIARDEIFGPVLSVLGFTTEMEALTIANDTQYGLVAAVWTKDIDRAYRVAGNIRAGTVWINTWDGVDMSVPFGGTKQSGFGRDRSVHAFDKYTQLKTTWLQIGKT